MIATNNSIASFCLFFFVANVLIVTPTKVLGRESVDEKKAVLADDEHRMNRFDADVGVTEYKLGYEAVLGDKYTPNTLETGIEHRLSSGTVVEADCNYMVLPAEEDETDRTVKFGELGFGIAYDILSRPDDLALIAGLLYRFTANEFEPSQGLRRRNSLEIGTLVEYYVPWRFYGLELQIEQFGFDDWEIGLETSRSWEESGIAIGWAMTADKSADFTIQYEFELEDPEDSDIAVIARFPQSENGEAGYSVGISLTFELGSAGDDA